MKRSLDSNAATEKRFCTGQITNMETASESVNSVELEATGSTEKNDNNSPEVTQPLPTPKISSAAAKNLRAQFFAISVDANNLKSATCQIGKCQKVIKMCNGNTTGLKRHLEREHLAKYKEMYGETVNPRKIGSTRPIFIQEEFENMLIDVAAKKYLPFSFFDDGEIQALFHYANPNVIVPKRDLLRSKTLERFGKLQKVVMGLLQENASKISFTVDAWTSVANKSYYGITGHFIDDQWNMQSLVIDFVPSNGSHCGRDIARIFYDTLNEYKLLEKLLGITLDNASANTVFLTELGFLMEANNFSFDPENQHFRCFAHVINLAVNDMLRIVQANIDDLDEKLDEDEDDSDSDKVEGGDCTHVLTKLKKIFKKVKYSEQLTRKLKSCCETCNIKMQTPNLGVATRWNSTCDMILSALQMKPALNLLCENSTTLNFYNLSAIEWTLLKELVQFLRHFKALSAAFSGEKYATLPLVVIGVNMMLDKLESFILSHQRTQTPDTLHDVLHKAAVAARDKLIKHYAKSNWMYCVILILDPRHKIETFQQTHWGKEMARESVKQFELIYRTKYYDTKIDPVGTKSSYLPSTSGSSTACNSDVYQPEDVLDLGSLFECNSSQGSGWRSELDTYLGLPRADRDENILTWWSNHEKKFPTLSTMAKDFLCIQATSVSVERFFSKASLVIRKHRNRLNNESARSLLCLNSWITCSLSEEIKKRE